MCVCIQEFNTYLFSSTGVSSTSVLSLSLLKLYCMAANSQSRGLVGLGKRFVNQIRAAGSSRDSSHSPSLALRRSVHASVYDKNVEDQVRPTVVPDDVIGPHTDKYWAPHPQTGVFGPSTEHNPAGFRHSLPVNGGESSVLEQKAFFRPQEGLEKPTEDQL